MKPVFNRWKPAEIERLKALVLSGKSYVEISEVLGRTVSACRSQGSNLGLSKVASTIESMQNRIPHVDRSQMSLTALMLGDPPPGRSALDQGASA